MIDSTGDIHGMRGFKHMWVQIITNLSSARSVLSVGLASNHLPMTHTVCLRASGPTPRLLAAVVMSHDDVQKLRLKRGRVIPPFLANKLHVKLHERAIV